MKDYIMYITIILSLLSLLIAINYRIKHEKENKKILEPPPCKLVNKNSREALRQEALELADKVKKEYAEFWSKHYF